MRVVGFTTLTGKAETNLGLEKLNHLATAQGG